MSANHVEVDKGRNSDWTGITVTYGGGPPERITIRSLEELQMLHFMLGQLLGKEGV
ncbi:MAG: hypothetical protein KGL39_59900 [Patescibacteria group bacterium]|nr:hypothetical protein [Patescibacteria group bacterium]